MPKPCTYPDLLNKVPHLNISLLKELGCFSCQPEKKNEFEFSWFGNNTNHFSIYVTINGDDSFVEFSYDYLNQSFYYTIPLVSIPSNIGNGIVWYFQCPKTKKRCRKLYLINGYFVHREAIQGCMYESQTKSKNCRIHDKSIDTLFSIDQLQEQLNKKHFKKYYAGKPTKRFLRITEQLEEAQKNSNKDMERLFTSLDSMLS